jgi:peptidoglycan/xylan/chitin deacetylase (PgdA/CDA1 family)
VTAGQVAAPSGPSAGVWQRRRLGRRVAANLMRVLPVRAYGALFPRRAIGLCYHVVSDRDLPHVRNLYGYKSPEQFEADLVFLKRNFEVVSIRDLESGSAPPNAVVLTFDDGLRECFAVVRPLLLRHGLPCAFFISPTHLGDARMFPFERASLALDRLQRMEAADRSRALERIGALLGQPFADVPALARWLTAWIRTLEEHEEATLDEVCEIAGVDVAGYLREVRPYLTADEVRILAGDGFTIGGHGLRHVALGAFPPEVVRREILESCQAVAALTGEERVPFAFPFDADGVDRELLAELRADHPEVGLLFNSGRVAEDPPFLVNRMIVDVPAVVGRERSNLAGYLRTLYLDEIAFRARGLAPASP